MKNKRNILFVIGITVSLVAGFNLGQMIFEQQESATIAKIRAIVPETPRKLAIPALKQGDGGIFDIASLQGKWTLLFFGYTNCPDICPATLGTVAHAKKQLEQSGMHFPQVVFVSVDPVRDDVKVLGEYVSYFDKEFIGVTGEEKLLRAIAVQMDSTFMTQPSENASEYLVGHSASLILINPEAELVAVLAAPHTAESILNALEYFQQ